MHVFDIAIIMNNYFHDVATAVLLSAAVIMWVLGRNARAGGPLESAALARAYPTLSKLAIGAPVWIVVGGVIRFAHFDTHDLGAVFDQIGTAIVVKHVFEVAAVVLGIVLWRQTRKMIDRDAAAG
jgi:uncharacterized membrane protein